MTLAEGDEEKARHRYIALRVEKLSNASATAPPEDPAPMIDSSDEGLRSAPDNRSSVESSASPESKADDKPIPWVPTLPSVMALVRRKNAMTLASQEGVEDLMVLPGIGLLARSETKLWCVTDVSPLAGLTNLTRLELWHNKIKNVSPLTRLTNLTELCLHYNKIPDIQMYLLRQALPHCRFN